MSELLTLELPEVERSRLEQLLSEYRSGMILKARAVREAVHRGLRPSLDSDAA